jgi:biopolymer transport protein ExbB
MKKLIVLLLATGVMSLSFSTISFAQEAEGEAQTEEQATVAEEPAQQVVTDANEDPLSEEDPSFHQVVKEQFIAGGWQFMSVVLICLILGLAIAIERIITLNLATTNTKKLLAKVDEALSKDGVDGAKEVCKNTRGLNKRIQARKVLI